MTVTLCFIPCCKCKTAASDRDADTPILTAERIPETWQRLQAGRKRMSACIEQNSPPCRALFQYDGGLYNAEASFREDIARCLDAGRLDLYVLSAGYGVIHALDPIRPYEAEMKGRVAGMWKDTDLPEVIAELIRVSRARRVFGFFAGPAHYGGAHAKYRYFFTEGVRTAASSGATFDATACFHRERGLGTRAITGALGRTLLRGLRSDFSPRFLAEHAAGRVDGRVIIGSDNLLSTAAGLQRR